MFDRLRSRRAGTLLATSAAFAASTLLVMGAAAAAGTIGRPNVTIAANQTDAYGAGQVIVFTYGQSFDCVETPSDDLDKDHVAAASDPMEVNGPHCVSGFDSAVDPTGGPSKDTAPLYVIVPFFETNRDVPAARNPDCRPGLGDTGLLAQLHFLTVPCDSLGGALQAVTSKLGLKRADGTGIIPDAFKVPTPGDPTRVAPVQCPEPGPPLTAVHGPFGTCTTHTSIIDLGPVIGNLLGLQNVRVPTPNHSHIIDNNNYGQVWWKVVVELVVDPSIWPNADGSCQAKTGCLTSVDAMHRAQAAGKIFGGDIPTNFYLFFGADQFNHH